jgi:hypothetical protein
LATSLGRFMIDPATDMLEDVADHIARTYEAAGFDWVSFDGAQAAPEPIWYTVARGQLALLKRLDYKPVMVQTAFPAPFTWHTTTRQGQHDFFRLSEDPRAEIDSSVATEVPFAHRMLMAAEIGWFPFHIPGTGRRRLPSIDEVEYLYTKALAANAAVSVLATVDELDALPHRGPILATMKRLEGLRLNRYFSEETKARVREPGADFMLVQDAHGAYHLLRAQEIRGVVGGSREVRAFLADPLEGVQTVSLWNVGPPVRLELATPIDSLEIADYLGKPADIEALPNGHVGVPVNTRLYMKLHGVGSPEAACRRARVTRVAPDER